MLLRELHEDITPKQLDDVEAFADRLWGKLGIDVTFTKHFVDRMNDERNGKPVSAAELVRLFKREYERWGKVVKTLDDGDQAVFKDLVTSLNLPFVIRDDELVAKTVLRKPDFSTTNQSYEVS
jgi:hypothetical protein